MDFQQPHHYMRPPPPPPLSAADPHHPHDQPPPLPTPSAQWYPGPQFQYSASPPPQQWAPPPPPHSDHLQPYPAPPPYYQHLHQYPPPPPPPPLPPRPPPYHHSQVISQPYVQVNQDWNSSWNQHQGWVYPAHKNEEDWAAKAQAYAASNVAADSQYPPLQFSSVGRPEDQSHYHDHYPQHADFHNSEAQQLPLPVSSYQQYPPPVAPLHMTSVGHLQDTASFSSGYVPDGHLPYAAKNGSLAHQEIAPTTVSVRQQEVPSSYSSVAGKEEAGNEDERFYKSLSLSSSSQQHAQPPAVPAGIGSVSMEQSHFAYGNQPAEPTSDLSDRPLEFAPRFSRDHDPLATMPSIHAWALSGPPGVVYPPVPSLLSSGPQVDPSMALPSTVPGHSAPIYGGMPGPNFNPTIPAVSTHFGMGTGAVLHPITSFPSDAYGAGVSERSKKASVPSWLREEIIKKKPVITSSASDISTEEVKSIEDEVVDKSLEKDNQADNKSIDSSKSTEDEDEDEDSVEAARTAAINQEIKRVLTEVLLKVTDELFDEIATRVLTEGDLSVEVDHNDASSYVKVSASTPSLPTPKASAKVLIPEKTKEMVSDYVSEKSTLSSGGDVLGLASYASDEEEDDRNQNSKMPNSRGRSLDQLPSTKKISEDLHVVANGTSLAGKEELNKNHTDVDHFPSRVSTDGATVSRNALISELIDDRAGSNSQSRYSFKAASGSEQDEGNIDGRKLLDNISNSKGSPKESVVTRTELPVENSTSKQSILDDSQGREARDKVAKNNISAGKDTKEAVSGKDRISGRGDESRKIRDERHARKERTDDRDGSSERLKEQVVKSGEKSRESGSRKRSTHPDVKEDRKERERNRERRGTANEDGARKRERTKDEKGEKSRHKLASDSSRHKRRRSSSVDSRGRSSKANDSSDKSSDDSRRKVNTRRRNLSPSPVRSRRRQVSRSPNSRRSQRRHSPYSSLETTRGRRSRSRSRSRSPVRRQR